MKNIFFTALLLLVHGYAGAQLTGLKNIPGNYATLELAIQDLNAQGVGAGGVTLNLLAGNPQTAPGGGYMITAQGMAADPIVIQGNGNTITAPLATVALTDAVFKIVGGDYITLTQFVMVENPANTTSMIEWGVALLVGSTSNGAQFNTIIGNTITLDKSYQRTVGIYSNTRHQFSNPATASVAGNSTTAPNNNNRVLNNTISNVNAAVIFCGALASANMDQLNEIRNNNITNFGGQPNGGAFMGVPSSEVLGIYLVNQNSHTISDNIIVGAPFNTTYGMWCIKTDYAAAPSGAVTNTISRNTVTLSQAGTSTGIGINTSSTAGAISNLTLDITDNLITNCVITNSATLTGIINYAAAGVLNITGNTFRNNTTNGPTIAFANQGGVTTTINLSNNHIGDAAGDAVTYNAVSATSVIGIGNSAGASSAALIVNGNDFRRIVFQPGSSAVVILISNNVVTFSQTFNSNTFTALNLVTSGFVTFFSNSVALPAGGSMTVHNNSIVGGFSKSTGGNVTIHNSNSIASAATATKSIQGNNFSNISVTATDINGWLDQDGGTGSGPQKSILNNTFSNWTSTGSISVLRVDKAGTGTVISDNTISVITGSTGVTGMSLGANNNVTLMVSNNTISNLSATVGNTTGILSLTAGNCALTITKNTVTGLLSNNTVNGIFFNGYATHASVTYNKIADIKAAIVRGLYISTGTNYSVSNNFIGDLRTGVANSSNAISGIVIDVPGTVELYYNTIYLNAVTTGSFFGSSGISLTGSAVNLTMRNNLVVNLSTPTGGARTVAFRRADPSLASYAAASDNNAFYAGTPSAFNLIYFDGTNSDQTISAYKTRLAPREAASLTVNPVFVSTTAVSPVFLHIPAAVVTALESGGSAIPGYTTDYDNDTRPGPAGSLNGGGTAPDIGADEFDGMVSCNGMPAGGTANITPTAATCGSGTFALSLTGQSVENGVTYQWQSSASAGGPFVSVPGATAAAYTTGTLAQTTYFVAVVTCVASGLSSVSPTVTATVNPLPNVTAAATQTTICAGTPVIFFANGASDYSWTGGVSNNSPIYLSATETFTVTGTDANGCQNTDEITLTVNEPPNVTAAATQTTVCAGASVTLSGNGASTYSWSGDVDDNTAFTPTATETFTVTGTDSNGCENTDEITVVVNQLPVVALNLPVEIVCPAQGSFALSGETPTGGTWSGNGVTGSVFDPVAAGSGLQAINYTYTDANGCTAGASDEILVDDCSGVEEMAGTAGITLYPNPNNGQFVIELSAEPAIPLKVTIMNELGQLVKNCSLATSTQQVDLSAYEDGVYLVRATVNGQTHTWRVVKQ